MGDAEGQGRIARPTIFLDENHCGNVFLHEALRAANVRFERHLDHFSPGTADAVWIPWVATNGWVLLTSDIRIRKNQLERQAVRSYGLRMFYFARNDIGGREMGLALSAALPRIVAMCSEVPPPFAASVTRKGEVTLRDQFT